MDDIKFTVEVLYGSVESKVFYQYENGGLASYGYSIHYDREGNEVSRTEPSKIGLILFN